MLPFRLRHTDLVAGIFLLVALVSALAVGTVLVFKQNVFEKRMVYEAVFKEGYDLNVGSRVKIAGIEVGLVREVDLTGSNEVKVMFDVRENFADRIRTDSVVSVDSVPIIGGLLGAVGLKISIGSADKPVVPDGGAVRSEDPRALGAIFETLQNQELVSQVVSLIRSLSHLAATLSSAEGSLQRILSNVAHISEQAAADNSAVMVVLTEGERVGRLLGAFQQLLAKADRTLTHLESLSTTADSQVKHLFGTTEQEQRAVADEIRAELQRIVRLTAEISGILKSIAAITVVLDKVVPRLPAIIDDVEARLGDAEEALRSVRALPFIGESPPDEEQSLMPVDGGGRP